MVLVSKRRGRLPWHHRAGGVVVNSEHEREDQGISYACEISAGGAGAQNFSDRQRRWREGR